MSSIPVPDKQTYYSSRRHDDVDALAWPVFSEHALDLLRSAGEVLHPEPGEPLWDTGDAYDLYLVLAGAILLLDGRDARVVFVIEEGDFVGELGMLMGQRAFLSGVATEGSAVLRVRVGELRRLVEISGELSDVLLSAFDARRRLLKRMGEGGLVLAGDDDRDLHRLQEFAERNQFPYRTVLRSDAPAWSELAKTTELPEAGTAVVTGGRRVMTAPTTRDGQAALFPARDAGQVHVLIRRDDLRDTMSSYLAQRLTHHERITVHPRSELSAVHGTNRLSAVTWRDHVHERDVTLEAAGLFMMIGASPSTTWLHGVGVQLDGKGFVVTRDGFVTSVPGVFAVGDVRAGSVKRVASAVGEGSVVISAVHTYLAGTKTS